MGDDRAGVDVEADPADEGAVSTQSGTLTRSITGTSWLS